VSASFFNGRGEFSSYWIDPPTAYDAAGFDLETTPAEFLTYYYRPLLSIVQGPEADTSPVKVERIRQGDYLSRSIPSVGLTLGVNTRIVEASERGVDVLEDVALHLREELSAETPAVGARSFVGADGIRVVLDDDYWGLGSLL
jgi:hypothetical protein